MSGFSHPFMRPAALALAAIALAAAMGLAFAGWLEHAPAIFMALVESGLAWCF
jgi:hypothetical protein